MTIDVEHLPDLVWHKRGNIFDPSEHKASLGGRVFAQGPQPLKTEDGVRVFFSTRERDCEKFLSHVYYADFEPDFSRVKSVAHTVGASLGPLGTFDEHGIFPFHVFSDDNRVLAYTCGWSRRVSVSVETAIGLSVSTDGGNHFERFETGPILGPCLSEPFLVGDPFVRWVNGTYHMWYMFGTKWIMGTDDAAERVYKIGHVTSKDGITWPSQRSGLSVVDNVLGENECQAYPTVFEHAGLYVMIFCYRYSDNFRTEAGRGYRLGMAFSDDLISWVRADEKLRIEPEETNWDNEMMCYPCVFEDQGQTYLLYNGNAFGKAGFGVAVLDC